MKKTLNAVFSAAQSIGAVAIFASGIILTLNVLLRLIIDKPLPGSYELVGYTAVIFASAAYPLATLNGGHVVIDTLTMHMSRVLKIICEGISVLVDIFVSVFFCWSGYQAAMRLMGRGEVTDTLKWPLFPARFLWVLGSVLMIVAGIYRLCTITKRIDKKPEPAKDGEEGTVV